MLTLGLLSRDTADAYLAEGLADAIASRLGRGGHLVVTSRTYVRRLRGADTLPPVELGRALNAAYLVSGSVLRAGTRLRVTMELVRAVTGRQVWSEAFDRSTDEVLAIESDVAGAIVAQVLGHPPPAVVPLGPFVTLPSRPTASDSAYDLYLRGRYLFNKQTRESLEQSLDYFHAAIARDSGFASAYVAIANTYFWLADDWMSPHEAYPRIRKAAERALALDAGLVQAHTLLGTVRLWYDWDRSGAASELTRAIALEPTDATAHHYYAYYFGGGSAAGLAQLDTAQRLDPLNPLITAELAGFLSEAGRSDDAISVAQRALSLDSTQFLAWLNLGEAYLAKQDFARAATAFERCRSLRWARCSQGLTHALVALGRLDDARAIVTEMERRATREYAPPVILALALASIGAKERALLWLDRALDERSGWLYGIDRNPVFAALRGDPRFERIVRRVAVLRGSARD